MNNQDLTNYQRIAEAIAYIRAHFKEQPSLETIAERIHVSPFHFQRLFSEWAGVSPKKFLQYISLEHARKLLKEEQASLQDTALDLGLSGTGRLHDLFVTIEGMTPGEYKNGGEDLSIRYSYSETPFGKILVASTPKGICHMAFADDPEAALLFLKAMFPNARYQQETDVLQINALKIFDQDWSQMDQIRLHLKGSEFQLKVWEALLKIPLGQVTSYGTIARQLQQPKASRAVGSAVGDNPVAFLIPCHRVIQAGGQFGNYHWGPVRKTAIIGWEVARQMGDAE